MRGPDGTARIEFMYADGPEPEGGRVPIGEHVIAVEGKYSRRLLAIEVRIEGTSINSVELAFRTMDSAWDGIARVAMPDAQLTAMDIFKTAVHSRESELRHQMAGR